MNQTSRIFLLVIMVILLMILLPVLMGTGVVGFMEDNEYPDGDDDASVISHFPMEWVGSQFHQLSVILRLAVSIFALFVVFRGGRSKNSRFNDRTFEFIKSSIATHLKTALFRAVFCFLLSGLHRVRRNHHLINVFSSKNPNLGGINP